MPDIVQIQRYKPDPEGSGGSHRIYQIYQDLLTIFGNESIGLVYPSKEMEISKPRISYYQDRINGRLKLIAQLIKRRGHPGTIRNFLLESNIIKDNPFGDSLLQPYTDYLSKNGKPKICIADYPSLLEIARFNKENRIHTIYCPHNLESLTNATHNLGDKSTRSKNAIQWMNELEMLDVCDERLMISKLELDVVNGLGISGSYYPYYPVGEIRTRLLRIRENRIKTPPEKALFLMLGSVFHKPTREGIRWVLNNIKKYGINKEFRIIVGGNRTETLRDEFCDIQGVDIQGRFTQTDLDQIMNLATAILIPQFSGFGAVTRISEASCAGIPVITSTYAAKAITPPPGVNFINKSWDEWVLAMELVVENPITTTYSDYNKWELTLPHPLEKKVHQFLENE